MDAKIRMSQSDTVSLTEKPIESFRLEDVEVLGESDESEELPDDGWTVEELYLPQTRRGAGEITPFDGWDWDYGPSLSRHRRDLVPGSGGVVGKCILFSRFLP